MSYDEKEHFEERSAIREYDGGQSRQEAELGALEEVEQEKFRCMIRQLIRWKNTGRRDDVIAWLDKSDSVPAGRDPAERKRYADALNKQLQLGNKGNAGEWKEQPTEKTK